ncbi:MAG: response regulator transcription factor [Spirulinaceae cyanobacterium]
MRILLVEDDIPLAETLAEALSDLGYIVDLVSDGEIAWQYITTLEYDIVLLDVMLPKLSGLAVCQKMRSQNYTMPILMLTARDTSNDKVAGLDAGADDYVIKPIDLPELFARIRALLRRGNNQSSPILRWESLTFNPSTFEAFYDDKPLNLTQKEYSFLELFLRNGRRVLSRSIIIEHIWSLEDPPGDETVKTYIKSLRRKLRAAGAPRDLIETVHSIGYRLKQI